MLKWVQQVLNEPMMGLLALTSLFVSGVSGENLAPIAQALAVPEMALRKVFDATLPRFDRLDRLAALFAWYPILEADADLVRRTPVLLVGHARAGFLRRRRGNGAQSLHLCGKGMAEVNPAPCLDEITTIAGTPRLALRPFGTF